MIPFDVHRVLTQLFKQNCQKFSTILVYWNWPVWLTDTQQLVSFKKRALCDLNFKEKFWTISSLMRLRFVLRLWFWCWLELSFTRRYIYINFQRILWNLNPTYITKWGIKYLPLFKAGPFCGLANRWSRKFCLLDRSIYKPGTVRFWTKFWHCVKVSLRSRSAGNRALRWWGKNSWIINYNESNFWSRCQ